MQPSLTEAAGACASLGDGGLQGRQHQAEGAPCVDEVGLARHDTGRVGERLGDGLGQEAAANSAQHLDEGVRHRLLRRLLAQEGKDR